MEDIYIVGVGMTPFGRHTDKSIKQLTAWAVEDALSDAGCDRKSVQAAFFGNCTQGHFDGQHMIRGQVALLPLGFDSIPIFNLEGACASSSHAFNLAVTQLRAGAADVVLAVGAEKMFYNDKAKMFSAFESAWDIETFEDNKNYLSQMGKNVEVPPGSQSAKPYSPFMDVYAALGRGGLMERFGITQRQLAAVASKNHGHSVHNERAQYRNAMTIEEVLAAPPITYPITLPMCSPISDGAAAAIVCTGAALKKHGFDRSRAVRVLASVVRSASARAADEFNKGCTHLAGKAAFEQAGISPQEVDVAEIHDATAIGELLSMEALGLCEPGTSGVMAERGETSLGGKLPVNPSGGLESKGHPIGATGIGQIFELVEQLRGNCGPRQVEGARIALQGNGGGLWRIEESTEHVGIFARA
ncbi:thiolase family protein [Paraburkholderia sartisoli]|uniref:Acetyl-CoA acetyltransferase n=1 Tax=Paraburkholderia sartisoli TaxID=83784 RepID=A0A1H4B0Z2_9BURK|nr:thiolase family protein [Paraburkholderia sartisoli]SEA41821.1 Acetyl-CoA acetyltransferase [Paraburkholderia sartisoli]